MSMLVFALQLRKNESMVVYNQEILAFLDKHLLRINKIELAKKL